MGKESISRVLGLWSVCPLPRWDCVLSTAICRSLISLRFIYLYVYEYFACIYVYPCECLVLTEAKRWRLELELQIVVKTIGNWVLETEARSSAGAAMLRAAEPALQPEPSYLPWLSESFLPYSRPFLVIFRISWILY